MIVISATELQNNFEKHLKYVQNGKDVIILRNGKEVARIISNESRVSFLTDSLVGVLKRDYAKDNIQKEKIRRY